MKSISVRRNILPKAAIDINVQAKRHRAKNNEGISRDRLLQIYYLTSLLWWENKTPRAQTPKRLLVILNCSSQTLMDINH